MEPREIEAEMDTDAVLKHVADDLVTAGCVTERDHQMAVRAVCEGGEIVATVDGDWLRLSASVARHPRTVGAVAALGFAADAELLSANSGLGGGARWVRPLGHRSPRLIADLDISLAEALPQRIAAAVAGTLAALGQRRGPLPIGALATPGASGSNGVHHAGGTAAAAGQGGARVPAALLERWEAQLATGGYTVHRHGDGDIRVQLPGHSEFRVARFVVCAAGGFLVAFEFDPQRHDEHGSSAPASVCTNAVGAAALAATAALRAARASLVEESAALTLRLEVWLCDDPFVMQIDGALEALGAAVDQCAAEITLLGRSAAVAAAYLATHAMMADTASAERSAVASCNNGNHDRHGAALAAARDLTAAPRRVPVHDGAPLYGPIQQSPAPQ